MVNILQRTLAGVADVHDTSGGFPDYVEGGPLNVGYLDPRAIFTGLRYTTVGISGVCNDAVVKVIDADFGTTETVLADIHCEDDSGSPGTWSSGDSPPDRTLSTASVTWDYEAGGAATVTSTDFAAVVDELIASYTTITNLHVVILSNAAGGFHDVEDFESDPTKSPQLDLNYTVGEAARRVMVTS